MEPTNQNRDLYKSTCTTITPASCVKWPTNIELSVIELCKGDSVVDIVFKLSSAIEKIDNEFDKDLILYDCLISCDSNCDLKCADDRTLTNTINCIISDHCTLKDRVETLSAESIFDDISFECIHEWSITERLDADYTDKELIDYLNAVICEVYSRTKNDPINTEITFLKSEIARVEALIPFIDVDANNELDISAGCSNLWTGTKNITEGIGLFLEDYSKLKNTIIGSSNACTFLPLTGAPNCIADINTIFASWDKSPIGTESDSFSTIENKINTLYDGLCKIVERVDDLGDVAACCRKSCKDYDYEIFVSKNSTGYEVRVPINGAIGPIDNLGPCGEKVSFYITDRTGITVEVSTNYTEIVSGPITILNSTLNGLDLTTELTFELKGCIRITNDDGSMADCYICESTKTLASNTTDCEICNFTMTGGTDNKYNVRVTYLMSGELENDVITVTTNQFTLPSSATIVSLVNLTAGDSINITSDSESCDNKVKSMGVSNVECFSIFINDNFSFFNVQGFEINGEFFELGDKYFENLGYPNGNAANPVSADWYAPVPNATKDIGPCPPYNILTNDVTQQYWTNLLNTASLLNSSFVELLGFASHSGYNDPTGSNVYYQNYKMILRAPENYKIFLVLKSTSPINTDGAVISPDVYIKATLNSECTACG